MRISSFYRPLTATLALAALAPAVHAVTATAADALAPTGRFSVPKAATAATPPMGWNPWNAFQTLVTEDKILAVARAIQDTGLAEAGYRYINMDDGWWLKRRADGRIEVRTSIFPSAAQPDGSTSLRPFVDRLHGMGLKAGLYTDIGRNSCTQAWAEHNTNLPVGTQLEREIGAYGYQAQDMRLIFGEWGFDYIKVDACGLADFQPEKPIVKNGTYRALGPIMPRGQPDRPESDEVKSLYAGIRREIDTVRPKGDYVLSICNWGEANVNEWGKSIGHLWRTSADNSAHWKSMLHNFDSAASRPLYAGPGHWNDPDMLEVGIGEFDASHLVEARAHMSLWAILSAPLLLGVDVSRASPEILAIVGNRDVLAVNQDPAGNQGVIVARDGDTQVLAKSLRAPGVKAVALVNRGTETRTVTVPLARLNLDGRAPSRARDLWTGQDVAVDGAAISASLAPHETRLLLVTGQPELKDGLYLGEMPARINVAADGRAPIAQRKYAAWVPAQVNVAPSGQPLAVGGRQRDNGLGVLANSRLEVRLDGEFKRFRATAGANGDSGRPLTYLVYGDRKLLYKKRSSKAEAIDVPVKGVGILELVVKDEEPAAEPVAVAWAEARLVRR
jgi:hypothetical protein